MTWCLLWGRRYGINVCGEGGEYETLTLDCPLFSVSCCFHFYFSYHIFLMLAFAWGIIIIIHKPFIMCHMHNLSFSPCRDITGQLILRWTISVWKYDFWIRMPICLHGQILCSFIPWGCIWFMCRSPNLSC